MPAEEAEWRAQSHLRFSLLPACILLAASAGLFTVLLVRFPFDGLSGQDSYAYYYQAREIWDGLWGLPGPEWPFAGAGLYHWPVGYHLQIMLGFITGSQSEAPGRAITLAMAALVPLLVAWLVALLWYRASRLERTLAGLSAGAALLLTGVYNRAGLSLMADVPAIFWATLGMNCLLRAWPPQAISELGLEARNPKSKIIWAIGGGGSLGLSILLRYSSALLLGPAALYLAVWYWRKCTTYNNIHGLYAPKRSLVLLPALAIGAALCALLPQLMYTLSQEVRLADLAGAATWDLGNLFKTTLSGPDGVSTFTHPMAGFYFVDPLYDVSAGFLSPLYLPALALGIALFVQQRNWGVIAFVAAWWLIPAAFLSGGVYQAHRFVIMYLPPLTAFIGAGVAKAAGWIAEAARFREGRRKYALAVVGISMGLAVIAGFVQSAGVSSKLASNLAAAKNQELAVVAAARGAITAGERMAASGGDKPRAVVFGLSAALYHYTGWQVRDIYNYDETELARFLASGNGPRLAVVPEASMSTQWAGTPSGARWEWLRSRYRLRAQGGAGEYKVYLIDAP